MAQLRLIPYTRRIAGKSRASHACAHAACRPRRSTPYRAAQRTHVAHMSSRCHRHQAKKMQSIESDERRTTHEAKEVACMLLYLSMLLIATPRLVTRSNAATQTIQYAPYHAPFALVTHISCRARVCMLTHRYVRACVASSTKRARVKCAYCTSMCLCTQCSNFTRVRACSKSTEFSRADDTRAATCAHVCVSHICVRAGAAQR